MKSLLELSLIVLLAYTVPCAALAGEDEPAGDPAAELAALEAAVEASELGYKERCDALTPRFEAFAEKYEDREEALTARLWLLKQTWWQREAGTMSEAAGAIADEILKRHPTSKQLGMLAEYYYVFTREQKIKYFTHLREKSARLEVQAAAIFGLARMDIRSREQDTKAAAKALLKTLMGEKYKDVPWRAATYGEIADATLHPYDGLELDLGKTVPEIIGRDHTGKAMKLSDFRGKVVVLNFWGDW